MNTLRASAILRLPARISLAQNASDVVFEFGLDGKEGWVEGTLAEGAEGGAVHCSYITGKRA